MAFRPEVATQAAHVAKEWVNQAPYEKKEEESKRYAAQKAQAQTDKKLKDTLLKLAECDKAQKSVEASIEMQKAEEMTKAEQATYDLGQKETAAHLEFQITTVCRGFCLQSWTEALDAAGVDPTSKLRDLERVFYPLAIRTKAATSPQCRLNG
uniref:Uncharacterized protein n=1 Tax=Quercus lobata TaxID=97700 RepID=A0A7N2MQ43_QUELO